MRKVNKYGLKIQLNELLNADKEVTIEFNCGNDEAHIVPIIDGKVLEYGELYFDLDELIFNDLNLPSHGDYMVTGTGHLKSEDNNIFLFYDLEGFTHLWDEDEEVCNSEGYEPRKIVTDRMKEKHLLLSSEYDDPTKMKEYLESENIQDKVEAKQNNFSNSDQKIWNELKGERSKPWWKFW